MGLVRYDINTIDDARSTIDICNSNIEDALRKINNELLNIESTLSTPKSSKTINSYTEYYDRKIKYLMDNRESYNKLLSDISDDYKEYLSTINEMVGGKL